MNDTFWMQQAYQLALKAKDTGEVPVGALIVDQHQALLGSGHNQVIGANDPTAHAEMIAIRMAAAKLGNHRLTNATLYVTLEPCSMCAGAMVQARLARLVFATRDFKAGAAGSVHNLLQGFPLNHKVLIDEGPMQSECAHLLADFFMTLRD
ncbi:tRNA adenosine(34) deaminase TadA [Legionella spiritensis]|uniref:tRNA-specific adenosine deaminase n=1 Tax=Legionella spiritensis TaxID=452 RepID=A0A0W0Z6L8_LEGSP|nr:tRNA adenosine(34) deaminase TadA [Legionella spiritensis]KTD64786.1 tRNA-specific adenosine deaminase [Legionella spiritensis]SNV39829.1 tRNA-specific adenosine deaminase [Legionella spiritensis]VEG90427.1 tRNA-specific adenosine deaminase [Legionella spiritensis]